MTTVVFDQSVFVKDALETVLHEGGIGLVLTSIMILLFLGSLRATSAVLLSIPLSALATFVVLALMGSTINTMILGGLALAFSRVIDNSVISLENIYRHLEMGASPAVAAEVGGAEVNLAVLAATLVDVVDFFPVAFLYGVSKFLFSALALAFCLSLLASFVVAMTVIPLFCSRFLKSVPHARARRGTRRPAGIRWDRFNHRFNRGFAKVLDFYERSVRRALKRPGLTVAALAGLFVASLAIYPLLGLAFFPRTDAGQFTINVKAPTGTRIEVTERLRGQGRGPDPRTSCPARPQDDRFQHRRGDRLLVALHHQRRALHRHHPGAAQRRAQDQQLRLHGPGSEGTWRAQFPEIRTFFSSGSMVDAILNSGMPAPIDVQVSQLRTCRLTYSVAQDLAARIRQLPGVGQVYIPQDMNYPGVCS